MAQSKELKNLLRRVRRFNLANPDMALNVEAIKKASPSKLSAASDRLARAQEIVKVNKRAASLARKINEVANEGHVFEAANKGLNKILTTTPKKTLTAAQRELQRIEKHYEKAADFRKRQDKFARKVKEYNRKLGLRDNKNRYLFLPRTERELAIHEKALKLVKRGKHAEAKKLLGIKENKELRKELLKRDRKSAARKGAFTYQDRIFLYQAIENARGSHVPELAQLFREGGESLILELESAGFTMIEYYDPDESMEDVGQFILAQLESTIPELNARNQIIVRNFIDRVARNYA